MTEDVRYRVDCSDTHRRFKFGTQYRWSYVRQIFRRQIMEFETKFFRGLRLEDEQGNLWQPQIQVTLVPVQKEVNHDSQSG